MPTSPRRHAAPPSPVTRALAGLRAFRAALRDVWQGYWDRPIGC